MERLIYNEWTVSGRVDYLNLLEDNEFKASIKLIASARRKNMSSTQILNFGCLMEEETYKLALEKGVNKNKYVTLSGHIESWIKQGKKGDSIKTRFVCDDILEVVE